MSYLFIHFEYASSDYSLTRVIRKLPRPTLRKSFHFHMTLHSVNINCIQTRNYNNNNNNGIKCQRFICIQSGMSNSYMPIIIVGRCIRNHAHINHIKATVDIVCVRHLSLSFVSSEYCIGTFLSHSSSSYIIKDICTTYRKC